MTRIGIAEPSAEIRRLIELVAAELGHDVFPVLEPTDVDDACDVLIAEPAHPTGLEAARRFRSQRPDAPIVVVSNRTRNAETNTLQPAAYLLKPFALAELAGALEIAIRALS